MSKCDIAKKISNANDWNFCFIIKTKSKDIIYATDYINNIKHNDITFLSSFGVEMYKFSNSETGEFSAEVKIFPSENDALINRENLIDADIEIYYYFHSDSSIKNWVSLTCLKIENNSSHFILHLESERRKYAKSIIKLYSKRCRAKLGDSKCGIDKSLFLEQNCDKSFSMCCNIFNNAINFRGEPFIPTYGYFDNKDE